MVAVICVDAYPFLAFSDLTCHLKDTGIGVLCTMLPDSKKPKLRSSNQETSSSAGKNNKITLVPYSRMEVGPYSYFRWYEYF